MSSNKYLKSLKQLLSVLPDRQYIQLYYYAKFRKFCNLDAPSTYNEKLQWMKLNYRILKDVALVDKAAVKDIIIDKIGAEYVIPTLGIYASVDEIDFKELPQSFVLKCTHDSEGIVLVEDKDQLDFEAAKVKLRGALKHNFYAIGREPHYRNLQPRIIAEPFLKDDTHGQLLDYKFFCFDGQVKAVYVASDRSTGQIKFDYYDAEFNFLDIRQSYPTSDIRPGKPRRFEEMLAVARKLSVGHPHVRVDLYEVNGRVYFGELTFFHFSGFAPFIPDVWDQIWGDMFVLPKRTVEY